MEVSPTLNWKACLRSKSSFEDDDSRSVNVKWTPKLFHNLIQLSKIANNRKMRCQCHLNFILLVMAGLRHTPLAWSGGRRPLGCVCACAAQVFQISNLWLKCQLFRFRQAECSLTSWHSQTFKAATWHCTCLQRSSFACLGTWASKVRWRFWHVHMPQQWLQLCTCKNLHLTLSTELALMQQTPTAFQVATIAHLLSFGHLEQPWG